MAQKPDQWSSLNLVQMNLSVQSPGSYSLSESDTIMISSSLCEAGAGAGALLTLGSYGQKIGPTLAHATCPPSRNCWCWLEWVGIFNSVWCQTKQPVALKTLDGWELALNLWRGNGGVPGVRQAPLSSFVLQIIMPSCVVYCDCSSYLGGFFFSLRIIIIVLHN